MKTKYTFNFSTIKKTVLEMDIAEVKAFNLNVEILNAVTAIWNATPIDERIVKTFRDDFTAQAVEWGFSEEWARKRLASLEFLRMRQSPKKAGGVKKPKPVTFTLDRVEAVLSEVLGNKQEIKAVLKALLS